MFASLTVLVFMMAFVKLTQGGNGGPYDQKGCASGQNYAPIRGQCDKYYQCSNNDIGPIQDERECAFGTFWNQDVVTCTSVDSVDCPYDPCKKGLGRYKAIGNCRGFYECVNGKSKPACCATGEMYVEGQGCIFDSYETCTDRCFGKPEPEQPPKECDKRPNADQNGFDQHIGNGIWVPMKCAPGTLYKPTACNCYGFGPVPIQPNVCQRELYLPFGTDMTDHSGNSVPVLVTNVELNHKGRAVFNGNSKLSIPRFSSLDRDSLYIHIKYVSYTDRKWRVLVSNKCQNTDYSVMLTDAGTQKRFTVKTKDGRFDLKFQQNQHDQVQEVVYQVDNGRFTATSGGEVKVTDINPKYIKQISCPINIGWAAGRRFNGFIGEILEVSIYLCNPLPRY